MERLRCSPTKRRRKENEKCPPSLRPAQLRKQHGKNHNQHQASSRPFHWRGLARSSSTSQSALDLRDWRRYADLRCERGHFNGRTIHGGGPGGAADPSMPGEKRAVLQELHTTCRPKEAAASFD